MKLPTFADWQVIYYMDEDARKDWTDQFCSEFLKNNGRYPTQEEGDLYWVKCIYLNPVVRFHTFFALYLTYPLADFFVWFRSCFHFYGRVEENRNDFSFRWWVNLRNPQTENQLFEINVQFSCPTVLTDVGFSLFGEDYDFQFNLCLFKLFSLYISFDGLFSKKLKDWYYRKYGWGSRDFSLSLNEEYISIEFWRDDRSWDKPGFHLMFDWMSFLFGKQNYWKEYHDDILLLDLELPEKSYPITLRVYDAFWQRSRVKWLTKKITRADVNCIIPLPIPGKGENSYDQDDDCIYTSSFVFEGVDLAKRKLQDSVIKTRLSRSGSLLME